jgi:hypothetical protein
VTLFIIAQLSCPLGSAPLDLQQPVLCSHAEFSPLRCGVYHRAVFRQSTTAAETLGFLPCSENLKKFDIKTSTNVELILATHPKFFLCCKNSV